MNKGLIILLVSILIILSYFFKLFMIGIYNMYVYREFNSDLVIRGFIRWLEEFCGRLYNYFKVKGLKLMVNLLKYLYNNNM